MAKEITSRKENYSQWYNDLVMKADLAEYSAVRVAWWLSLMDIPSGKKCQAALDKKGRLKIQDIPNAYFPLFIPKSFFCKKKAAHVEGFAKECAIVTHYRLKNSEKGLVVDEDAKLEEELIIRPTSENNYLEYL